VLAALDPQPGQTVVDCTVGWGGHAVELLRRVGPQGQLIGIDFDPDNLPRARQRLGAVGFPFALHHGNFAGLATVLAAEGLSQADLVLADLGVSSMQLDDAGRGFSYVRDGPLDMRMDRSRGLTAAQLLESLPQEQLAEALASYGDEPEARKVAAAIVAARRHTPLERTTQLARVIAEATGWGEKGRRWRLHSVPGRWNLHPAARTFQALRIMVNRELRNLEALLRGLPSCLAPGGRAAVISFHSGEDRPVKAAFRDGVRAGVYSAAADEPVRPAPQERLANPRSRSAKLRWARR
jgi:16S rRNA (cytosine1402-N4)-methyltransferase